MNDLPHFLATLKYLSTEEGGRTGYALSGYRPHIRFPVSDYLTSGQQVFRHVDKVYPGENVIAEVTIVSTEPFKGLLEVGMQFEFGEGPKLIGTGTILELFNADLKKV